ncbi:MAG: diaminopimelate decarboxylase, partial [Spirochaetota bacterium]
MNYRYYAPVTSQNSFFMKQSPLTLVEKYGSPLYVYSEALLRERCREMKQLVSYEHFSVNYSAKANANL